MNPHLHLHHNPGLHHHNMDVLVHQKLSNWPIFLEDIGKDQLKVLPNVDATATFEWFQLGQCSIGCHILFDAMHWIEGPILYGMAHPRLGDGWSRQSVKVLETAPGAVWNPWQQRGSLSSKLIIISRTFSIILPLFHLFVGENFERTRERMSRWWLCYLYVWHW